MARYILLWEYDNNRCPEEMKDKIKQWLTLTDIVKKMLKSGAVKEWAHYAGEPAGYIILRDERDVQKLTDAFSPFVAFHPKALRTIDQCEKIWKSL